MGSAGDGFGFYASASASEGVNRCPYSSKATSTQDIDINIFINTLTIKQKHLKPVAGALGFTWISLPNHEVSYFHTVTKTAKIKLMY